MIWGWHDGEWKDGKKHGQGAYTFPSRATMKCEFKDDKIHQGVATSPNGDRYEGEWKDMAFHGQGVLTMPWGERYEGQCKDDKRHGQGVYTFADGSKNEGEFKNGIFLE